jgi:hypothetical protein
MSDAMPMESRIKIDVKDTRPTRTQSTFRVLSARIDETIPNAESTRAITTEKCPISITIDKGDSRFY